MSNKYLRALVENDVVAEEKAAAIEAWTKSGNGKTIHSKKRHSPKPQPKVRSSRILDEALSADVDDYTLEDAADTLDWRAELEAIEDEAEAEFVASFDNAMDEPCALCDYPQGNHQKGCPNSPASKLLFAEIDREIEDYKDPDMPRVVEMLRDTPPAYRDWFVGDWAHMVALSKTVGIVGGWFAKYWVSRGDYMLFHRWMSADTKRRFEHFSFDEPRGVDPELLEKLQAAQIELRRFLPADGNGEILRDAIDLSRAINLNLPLCWSHCGGARRYINTWEQFVAAVSERDNAKAWFFGDASDDIWLGDTDKYGQVCCGKVLSILFDLAK